jgi:probable rRNA maturation factor
VSIEIANESGIAVDETSIVSAARFTLDKMEISPLAELSVLLVTLDVMEGLHEQWMDLPGPTDVMAFPMDELDGTRRPDAVESSPALLGDIVLCPAFARDQAREAGHRLIDELHLLTVHGVLHLLGYDHAEPAEEREMFGLQKRILGEFTEAMVNAERRHRQRSADDRLLGVVGLTVELLLLEHTESATQLIPFAVLGAGFAASVKLAVHPTRGSLRLFQAIMMLFVVAGIVGVYLHVRGNVLFEQETDPSARGFDLIWRSMHGGIPLLAPGAMAQLGLVGLVFAYRHPILQLGAE